MTQRKELWTGDGGTEKAAEFGRYRAQDELLHPEASIPGDSLTETWAYLWYIPEEQIYSQVYIWVHPNLNVVTAGLGVWRGHKNSMISAEIMDLPVYVSASDLGDGSNMRFANGLHVEVLEPFKKIRITYSDPVRGNSLDLLVTDFSPPVMRGSEKHFDQATRNRGQVTLRGRTYAIDSYGMRDRSWGQLRTEAVLAAPPYTWMTGTFPGLQMTWHLSAYDDPARNPDWLGLFDVKPGETTHDAWLFRDGTLSRLKRATKITLRDPNTLRPVSHDITLVDQDNREYHITGKVTASLPWVGWSNMSAYLCLTEWSLDGETGWGDTQEVQWGDYVHAMRQDQDPPPPPRDSSAAAKT